MSRRVMALALVGALAGCTAPPPTAFISATADPGRTARTTYVSVTAGTQTYRPVEPKGWDDVNRQVAPERKGKRP